MPLYEYKCRGCGETFEIIQKFSDAPLETHPGCGGATERLLSPPALQFKGSGWYVTDYAGKNGKTKSGEKTESGEKKSGSDSSTAAAKSTPPEKKAPSSSPTTSSTGSEAK